MAETISEIQPPNFAGAFYPSNTEELTQTIEGFLEGKPLQTPNAPKVLIMPHAGYRYSGETAASAIRELRGKIGRVVIIGPTHRYAFDGIAYPQAKRFDIPNGHLLCDQRALRRASRLPFVHQNQKAFENEHSIEVELPFLRFALSEFRIAPFVVGRSTTEEVKNLIDALWGDSRTVFIISTDLSHFHDADTATNMDRHTAGHIEMKSPAHIGNTDACGWLPLRGILAAGKGRQLRFTRLDLTHSGKTSGDNSRVVGYGAWVGHTNENAEYSQESRAALYKIVANAIDERIKTQKVPEFVNYSHGHVLQSFGASFVTLETDQKLRGCIGSLTAHKPLANDVFINANKAAFSDPRFPPITAEEFEHLQCEIAVLDSPAPLEFESKDDLLEKLSDGNDGVVLQYQQHRATFLPKVWDDIEDADQFLAALMKKSGLPAGFWHDDIKIQTYSTERFPKVLLKDML